MRHTLRFAAFSLVLAGVAVNGASAHEAATGVNKVPNASPFSLLWSPLYRQMSEPIGFTNLWFEDPECPWSPDSMYVVVLYGDPTTGDWDHAVIAGTTGYMCQSWKAGTWSTHPAWTECLESASGCPGRSVNDEASLRAYLGIP